MGRSRGGLTTKIHALVDACGLPIKLVLSEGQAYDGHIALKVMDSLQEGTVFLADRAYDADNIRQSIRARGAIANIPSMPQRRIKPYFDRKLYKERNLVERFFNKIKHYRAIATRYEKDPLNYMALIKMAALRLWIRSYESVT